MLARFKGGIDSKLAAIKNYCGIEPKLVVDYNKLEVRATPPLRLVCLSALPRKATRLWPLPRASATRRATPSATLRSSSAPSLVR